MSDVKSVFCELHWSMYKVRKDEDTTEYSILRHSRIAVEYII